MRLRSMLFVPGDKPQRMEKAAAAGADAVIIDLEDSVAPNSKEFARQATASFLKSAGRQTPLLVRVNPLGSTWLSEDIAAILDAGPDGLVLPKAEGAASVTALASQAPGLPILPIATETPAAIFQIDSYSKVKQMLLGLTWGAEDLPAAIGASTSREADGRYTAPYELARSLTLFGGHAAGVPVIDTVYPAFKDRDGLSQYAQRARRDGFTGMMAIHPDQVEIINKAFTPSAAELSHARAVVSAFADNPGKGALQLEGRMIDAPHLKQAQRIIEMIGVGNEQSLSEC